MNFDFVTEQASSQWLTELLVRNGYVESGRVARVSQAVADFNAGASATIYVLTLTYSSAATGDKPSRVLMKVAKSGGVDGFEDLAEKYAAWLLLPLAHRYQTLHKEAVFYEAVRTSKSTLPLIQCYGSEIDYKNHDTCILLKDYSATHFQPLWPIPPEQKHCDGTIDALAGLHAHWWDNSSFGSEAFPIVDAGQIDEITRIYEKSYVQFSAFLGDRLSEHRRSIYERALTALPALLKPRFGTSNKLTLSHGDAHHWNILLPKTTGDVVIFDWQSWHVDTGTHDLAYLMGVLWFSEHRAQQEARLLERYRNTLAIAGIDYSKDDLSEDYRLSVLRHLFTPVIFSNFVPPAVWWSHLDRVFCTFEDWDCVELLN